jgi:carbonic anhydrase/acetyltransferase-like protein (isoleucine patch superfamily)
MTFEQLQEKIGTQDQADWSQHENGGGWVHKSAKVEKTAFIGNNAIVWGRVYGDSWVSGNAQVFGNAQVYGDAQVYGNAWVYGDAQVYGDARVYGDAQVYGDARVYGNAQVFGNARVSGNAWEKSPLFIVGTAHSLTNAKNGHIQIGCKCQPFDWWLSAEGEKFARFNGYSECQIKEYRAYVQLFKEVGV